MDRQDEALKLLKEIRNINHLIERLQEQIDEIYTMLTNATVKPKEIDVQTSLPTDPMADKVIKAVEYQKELQEYQSELIERKNKALTIIKQMSVDYQQLLLLRYFKGYSVEEVGQKTGYTYRWAWEKIHDAEEEFITIYEKTT
jgi:DNA-directed RNA polymerase specialized sigma24 family protein